MQDFEPDNLSHDNPGVDDASATEAATSAPPKAERASADIVQGDTEPNNVAVQGGGAPASSSGERKNLPVAEILIADQTRAQDARGIEKLADSIKHRGLLQPIIVRQIDDDDDVEDQNAKYIVVVGNRRLAAVKMLGWEEVPAFVVDRDQVPATVDSLTENIQRAALNPIREARAMNELLGYLGGDRNKVAEQLGIARDTLNKRLRLLELPEKVQELIENNKLSAGHGEVLWLIKDEPEEDVVRMAEFAVNKSLPVPRLENMVRQALEARRMAERRKELMAERLAKQMAEQQQGAQAATDTAEEPATDQPPVETGGPTAGEIRPYPQASAAPTSSSAQVALEASDSPTAAPLEQLSSGDQPSAAPKPVPEPEELKKSAIEQIEDMFWDPAPEEPVLSAPQPELKIQDLPRLKLHEGILDNPETLQRIRIYILIYNGNDQDFQEYLYTHENVDVELLWDWVRLIPKEHLDWTEKTLIERWLTAPHRLPFLSPTMQEELGTVVHPEGDNDDNGFDLPDELKGLLAQAALSLDDDEDDEDWDDEDWEDWDEEDPEKAAKDLERLIENIVEQSAEQAQHQTDLSEPDAEQPSEQEGQDDDNLFDEDEDSNTEGNALEDDRDAGLEVEDNEIESDRGEKPDAEGGCKGNIDRPRARKWANT